jgi:methylmalonyl-CoA mutase
MKTNFKADTLAQWSLRAEKELKGASPDVLNKNNSLEKPQTAYTAKETKKGDYPVSYKITNETHLWEFIPALNPEQTNKLALSALNQGANAIMLHYSGSHLGTLLNEIHVQFITTGISCSWSDTDKLIQELDLLCKERELAKKDISLFIKFEGFSYEDLESIALKLKAMSAAYPKLNFLIDVADLRESGLDLVSCMAVALDKGSALLQFDASLANLIAFSFCVSDDYYVELCALRCFNHLWLNVQQKHECLTPAYILGISSRFNLSAEDAYNNMLRNCMAALVALNGTCNGLMVHPFNGNNEDPFAVRMSKNLQLILLEEAKLGWVKDPAKGSYYLENLTFEIAELIWESYQTLNSLTSKNHWIEQNTASNRQNLTTKVNEVKKVIVGTNKYPATERYHIELPPKFRAFALSEGFESLKHKAKQAQAERPILLFSFGNPKMSLARTTFVTNFLALAGLEGKILNEIEAENSPSIFNNSIVFLCSADEAYENVMDQYDFGSAIVWLAGNPANSQTLKSRGVTDFVHLKSNIYKTLSEIVKTVTT